MTSLKIILLLSVAVISTTTAGAQEPFFKGKTVRIIVGFSPGGAFDVYSRVISRHIGKHIDGNPAVMVENMPGAGSLTAANHLYKVAKAWQKALDAGEVLPVVQVAPKPAPDLPKVPLAINLAKTDEARKLIEVGVHNDSAIALTYTLPPGTPKDRMAMLRSAFLETMKDPEFLAEMKKSRLEVDPVSGAEVEKIINDMFKLDAGLLGKLKEIFYK